MTIHPTPILVLSQFSKAGKNASFKDLDRTDIRGAGEKTEKANVVVLLHPNRIIPALWMCESTKTPWGRRARLRNT